MIICNLQKETFKYCQPEFQGTKGVLHNFLGESLPSIIFLDKANNLKHYGFVPLCQNKLSGGGVLGQWFIMYTCVIN